MSGGERKEGWAVPIDRVDAFTSGAAMAVEVSRIEQELRGLWRQAAERAQQQGSGLAVTRACLWNLIIHQAGEAGLSSMKATIDELSQAVPARVLLLLETDPDEDGAGIFSGDEPLRAFVEAKVRPGPEGRREVVAEEITLEARRLEARRLPSLVRSLLLPDLPTAVFSAGALPSALGPLAAEAERFLFDSGRLRASELARLARSLAALPEGIEVADLGWLRTASLRWSLACTFLEEDADALTRIDEVEISHAAGAEPAALLLGGWLTARLGWSVEGGSIGEGAVALRAKGGRPLWLRFALTDGRRALGGITGVSLRAGGERFRAEPGGTRCVQFEGPHLPLRSQTVTERRDSELLVRALGAFGRDPLMPEALRAAVALLGPVAPSATTPPMAGASKKLA